MNDFEYDAWQKKIIAQGARHKRTGSKSKSCTLSQDRMTNKELNEMNGEIVKFNLSQPMKWKQFRMMDRGLQKEYLEKLRDKFNVSPEAVAKMLGVDKSTFKMYCKDTVLQDPISHRRRNPTQEAEWQAFCNPPKPEEPMPEETVVSETPVVVEEKEEPAIEPKEEPAEKEISKTAGVSMEEFNVTMTGEVADILMKLDLFLGAHTVGTMKIEFSEVQA